MIGGCAKFRDDPHWRDCILFHEYFHGDDGAGIGASHQTGWTGAVATLIHLLAVLTASDVRHAGGRSSTAWPPERASRSGSGA